MVAELCTKVACIYPFAAKVYKEASKAPVEFVGNPLVDIVQPEMSPPRRRKPSSANGPAIRWCSCCPAVG